MKKKPDSYPYKLLDSLHLLPKDQYKLCQQWLKSPWCNTKKKCLELYRLLLRRYPDLQVECLDTRRLYRTLYPGKPYQHKSMLNLLSDLSLAIEDFLVHQQLKQSPHLREGLLRQVYRENGQLDQERESLKNELDELAAKEQQTEQETLRLALGYEQLYWQQALQLRGQSEIAYLESARENLDQFYTQVRLRMLTERYERTRVISGEPSDLKHELAALTQLVPDFQGPAAQWYYRYLEGEGIESRGFFLACKKQFQDLLPKLEHKDKTIILLLLINETARMKLRDEPDALANTLELYQLGLEENVLLYQGKMTARTFANIVSAANGLERYEYATGFIAEYGDLLDTDIKQDARLWAKALTAYLDGSAGLKVLIEALTERQRSVHTTTFSLRISVLLTQLRFDAYWRGEEKLNYAFWKQNDAFAKRLARRRAYSPKHIRALKRFNDYARKLAELLPWSVSSRRDFHRLKSDLAQEKAIHAKDWLLERIELIARE